MPELIKGKTILEGLDVSEKVKKAVEEEVAYYSYTPGTLEIIKVAACITDVLLTQKVSNNDVKYILKYTADIFSKIKVDCVSVPIKLSGTFNTYGKAKKYESGEVRSRREEAMAKDIFEILQSYILSETAALSVLEFAKEKVSKNKDELNYAYDNQSPLYQD